MMSLMASSGLAAWRRKLDAIAVSPLDRMSHSPTFRIAARI